MSEQWYRDYIQLGHRIGKAIHKFTANPFVDAYYGPPEWKTAVENEPEVEPAELVRVAMSLADALPQQGFDSQHVRYLSKQVLAMETICRRLAGEKFALEDEVRRCFDIEVTWTPETQFEEACHLLDEVLPPGDSLYDRQQAFRKRYELPKGKAHLLPTLLERTMSEVRRRTRLFVDLPDQEEMDIQIVTDKHYGGACWYLGNYRSRIDVNTDLPMHLNWLPYLVAHEGYPGHHTESVSKERHLYRERGYLDQSIVLLISPHCLVSEGIATNADTMIFEQGEVDNWLAEHIYPEVGLNPEPVDTAKVKRAQQLLEDVWGNAAILLNQGRSDQEVAKYMQRHMLLKDEEVPKYLEFLKVPFHEAYAFTYSAGRKLMEPWLQGSDRQAVFRRFLTEPLTPSDLVR